MKNKRLRSLILLLLAVLTAFAAAPHARRSPRSCSGSAV